MRGISSWRRYIPTPKVVQHKLYMLSSHDIHVLLLSAVLVLFLGMDYVLSVQTAVFRITYVRSRLTFVF